MKSDSAIDSIKIGEDTYAFGKNSISKETGKVSLTSAFSGTYKIKDGVNHVDGHLAEKNLTFKGTSANETLMGGEKKTTFKGGGGDDSLVGGASKDIFFYAKGDKGDSKIADFEFGVDKLKIANGTIHTIKADSGKIKFEMTSGRKGDTATIGSFLVESHATYGATPNKNQTITTSKTLIKANNTYYWFADGTTNAADGVSANRLITADTKVTRAQAISTGYAILDLGYSTNLVKSEVAVKAGSFSFSKDGIKKA